MSIVGRFAPSPTGTLHVGNLRTALAAWGSVRGAAGRLLVRFEDLDQHNSSHAHAASQLADLASLGIESDDEPVFQSDRFDMYRDAIDTLRRQGLVYECFCTRREIAAAAMAPHGAQPLYPGTCRELPTAALARRREVRPGALRLRANGARQSFRDHLHGEVTGEVDDVVLQRNDGVPAYNIAVVVDDALQGVTEVVRGDDLLGITATQVHLQHLLGATTPVYGHVPLVLGDDGERLAKRHGAVDLVGLAAQGVSANQVRNTLWESLGQGAHPVEQFDWDAVPRAPWVSPWGHGKS